MTSQHETTPKTISGIGQMMANIPALLGFYPSESLIFIGLDTSLSSDKYDLGPIVRVDIDDQEAIGEACNLASTTGSILDRDVLFACVVTEKHPESEYVADTLTTMFYQLAAVHNVPLVAAWHVPEILVGQRFRMIFGSQVAQKQEAWGSGQIPEILGASSMDPWHRAAQLPSPSRQEAYAAFHMPNPYIPAEIIRASQLEIEELIDSFPDPLDHKEKHVIMEWVEQACWLIDQADTSSVLEDHGLLEQVALALAHASSRDVFIHEVAKRRDSASAVLMAVARTYSGIIRANALCLYALVAVQQKLSMLAFQAISVSTREQPEHVLGRYLLEALTTNRSAEVTQAAISESAKIAARMDSDCEAYGCHQAGAA